jgi:hypothetical protein
VEPDYANLNGGGVLSVLGAFAVQTHELFTELQSAGFNEEQAIKILVGLASKE